jgi:hypothetical protein
MQRWKVKETQRAARQPNAAGIAAIVLRSIWHQGIRSNYRGAYWKYALRIVTHYALNPAKIWLAATIMIAGHHFIPYSRDVVGRIQREIDRDESVPEPVTVPAAD